MRMQTCWRQRQFRSALVVPLCPARMHDSNRVVYLRAEVDKGTVPDQGWLWLPSSSPTRRQLALAKTRPKKALGQHFVTDKNVLDRIIRESGVQAGDLVLEVGPGTGNLTRLLLQVCTHIISPPHVGHAQNALRQLCTCFQEQCHVRAVWVV
jgi:hypothetical protein